MNKRPALFMVLAVCLTATMAWANHRGYMVSSLFNQTDAADRSASGHYVNHK
jgi:hypothetical protein